MNLYLVASIVQKGSLPGQLASIGKVRRSLVDLFTEVRQIAIESAIVERSQFHLNRRRIVGDRTRDLEERQ
jgi:hypothetical protein